MNDKKLKVAVWHYLPSGGGKRALYEHIKGLLARGHSLEAWCPESVTGPYLPLSGLIRENARPMKFPEPEIFDKVLAKIFGYSVLSVKEQIEALEDHCRKCAEEINQKDFDVVFVNSSKFLAAAPIAKYLKKPAVLYLQEAYRQHHETACPKPEGSLKNRLRIMIEVFWRKKAIREEIKNARGFDKVLVNSEFSRKTIGGIYGMNPEVCYLGIDAKMFASTSEKKENFAISLGRLVSNKGMARVIRGLGAVDAAVRPKLVWVGDSEHKEYRDEMIALAKREGVDLEIKVLVTDAELVGLLSRAAFMIYMPHNEPFGFAPLEANACGTPVVALAEGGVKETVVTGVNGTLVSDEEPRTVAAAIEAMIKDKAACERLSKQARAEVERKWKWEDAVGRLEERLKQAAERHS